jgi:hypothetical protein
MPAPQQHPAMASPPMLSPQEVAERCGEALNAPAEPSAVSGSHTTLPSSTSWVTFAGVHYR